MQKILKIIKFSFTISIKSANRFLEKGLQNANAACWETGNHQSGTMVSIVRTMNRVRTVINLSLDLNSAHAHTSIIVTG